MSTPPYLQLPRQARTTRLSTPGGDLAAVDARPDSSSRGTALLVPGFTGSKEDFIAVLGPLAEAGWRVVALDLPGQYESPHAPEPSAYGMEMLGALVAGVARGLGPDVHLVGHSFGGLVSRAAVLADPRAFATLTLLCSGPAGIPEPGAQRLRLFVQAVTALDLATLWAAMRQLDAEMGLAAPPPALVTFLEHRFGRNDAACLRRIAEQLLDEPDRVPELHAAATEQALPVLVAHGAGDDSWAPAMQKDMAARLGAAYVVVPDAAHSPAAEAPAATAELLSDFWGGRRDLR